MTHIHPTATVETERIGDGSSIGAYSRVGPEVALGAGCTVGEHVWLSGPMEIGNRVEIAPLAYLEGPLRVEDGARIGPKVCVQGAGTALLEGAIIGAQATVWPGITVGKDARVEPGSVVSKNVPARAVVAGNPAQIVGYCGTGPTPAKAEIAAAGAVTATEVEGVTLHQLPAHEDLRGNLTFGEAGRHVPFPVKRYFLTFDVASQEVRGEHAHRRLHQFLVCVHGRAHIVADNGRRQAEFVLDRPHLGIHIPPMIWSVQYRFSGDAALLGLCSEYYDPEDYIRDYATFLALARKAGG